MKSNRAKDGGGQPEKRQEIKLPKRRRIAPPDWIICVFFEVVFLFQFDRYTSYAILWIGRPNGCSIWLLAEQSRAAGELIETGSTHSRK